MSGVLLLESQRPERPRRYELGISVFNTSVLASGYSDSGRHDWLFSARRSNLDLVLDKQDHGEPSYHDLFAEWGVNLSEALVPNPRDEHQGEVAAGRITRNEHLVGGSGACPARARATTGNSAGSPRFLRAADSRAAVDSRSRAPSSGTPCKPRGDGPVAPRAPRRKGSAVKVKEPTRGVGALREHPLGGHTAGVDVPYRHAELVRRHSGAGHAAVERRPHLRDPSSERARHTPRTASERGDAALLRSLDSRSPRAPPRSPGGRS